MSTTPRLKQDRSVYLPQDFDSNTEARCSTCDGLVNVHNWVDHKDDCFISKSHKCDDCPSEFNHAVNLEVHKLLKHAFKEKECSICKKKFKRDAAFRGHVNNHCVLDILSCAHCKEEFGSLTELTRHRRFKHSDPLLTEALICCACGEIFSPLELETHKSRHVYERILKKKTESSMKKIAKKNAAVPVVRPHICPICEKAFRRPMELKRHEAIHSSSRGFQCSFCKKSFKHETGLRTHEKLHKRTNKSFKCRMCEHIFNTKYNLHRHLQFTHMRKEDEELRPKRVVEEIDTHLNDEFLMEGGDAMEELPDHVVAEYFEDVESGENEEHVEWERVEEELDVEGAGNANNGGEEFMEQDDEEGWYLDGVNGEELAEQLFENREVHKERLVIIPENSLRCPACVHSFQSIEHLMMHFKTLVPKDTIHRRAIFHCLFCSESVHGADVYTHLLSHGISPQSPPEPPVRIMDRPHICSLCDRRFTKKIDLTRHFRTHTGEKPFGCRMCGERFRVETTLRRHEKTHSHMDPSHECTLCGKGFFSRNALRLHMMNHSTPCSLCQHTFKSVRERDEHTLREHSTQSGWEEGEGEGEGGKRVDRVGGLLLPSVPGALATLTQIVRPLVSKKLPPCSSSSAFKPIPSTSTPHHPAHTEKTVKTVNVHVEERGRNGLLMKISRRRESDETPPHTSRERPQKPPIINQSGGGNGDRMSSGGSGGDSSSFPSLPSLPSLSFAVPQHLLSSLQSEGGLLRTKLNRGGVVSVHPSETLSAFSSTTAMEIHPTESSSRQSYNNAHSLRSSSFVPVHVEAEALFIPRCSLCQISFSSKQESDSHMNSEDHETATLLAPHHGGVEPSSSHMACKLCGTRFVSMAPLVDHIRREHERDHPKSLAPLNLHTSLPHT